MQHKMIKTGGIFFTVSAILFCGITLALSAQNELPEKCRRLSTAVTGLNYHRSDRDSLTAGEIWRFADKGRLAAFVSRADGIANAQKLAEAAWTIEAEDERCVLKITKSTPTKRTQTFRIMDTTWAIVTIQGADKHIPDFEDHSGMKTRYCGTGERCEKLWR